MTDESRFESFDLTIHLGPEEIPWLSASSRIGLLHGIPREDKDIPPLDDLLDLVHDYRDAVQFAESSAAQELSKHLGNIVFGDPQVLDLFQATRGAAAERGKPMLVRILASPHLSTLPWELLPDPSARGQPNRRRYLTLAPDAHVVRMARGRTYVGRSEKLKPPLNLLIVLASPSPLNSSDEDLAFDIYEVKRSLLNELQPLVDAGLLRVDVEDRPTLENLRRCVGGLSRGYQLFHYVGHARPDHLILEDASGRREDQSSASICEILRLCPDLRLAVFAGCETARAATDPSEVSVRGAVGWRDLVSLADRCVQDACPVVIGMQALLPFRTERLFTRFFYQGVASGYSIAEALQLARGATRSDTRVAEELLDWSVPALYLGTGEPGPLIDRNAEATKPEPRKKYQLRVGLHQRETRFFARDLPLRQAVDVLTSRTAERVLLVTGTSGVGKTYLVDRALEEIGDAATHVLYVKLGRLIPALDTMLSLLTSGNSRALKALAETSAEEPLKVLCALVSDLLCQEDMSRTRPADVPPRVWWERLVEEICRRKFALILDEFELFDEVAELCVRQWLIPTLDKEFPINGLEAGQRAVVDRVLNEILELVRATQTPAGTLERSQQFVDELDALLAMQGEGRPPDWIKSAAHRVLEPLIIDRLELASSPAHKSSIPAVPGLTIEGATLQKIVRDIHAMRQCVESALRQVAERKSQSRVGVVTTRSCGDFLGMRPRDRFELRLGHLTWQETWRWIRRNLPGLTRYSERDLSKVWLEFGPELERWEALERRVLTVRRAGITLSELIEEVAPRSKLKRSPPATQQLARRGRRPLRIAIAAQSLKSPEAFADSISRLANEHGIGGRVAFGNYNAAATLGELVGPPTPFVGASGTASTSSVLSWLDEALDAQPDIVLLDFGLLASEPGYGFASPAIHNCIQSTAARCLFIAASGNDGPKYVSEPAIYPETLAVGAIDEDGEVRPYCAWLPDNNKPEIFMLDNLEGSELAAALDMRDIERIEGTSFAAFHATAAAILVWSLIPELRPVDVRNLIMLAAKPINADEQSIDLVPKSVTLKQIVDTARMRLIEDMLRTGPCLAESLAAIAGLDTVYIRETLEAMRKEGRVVRTLSGRLERFELG